MAHGLDYREDVSRKSEQSDRFRFVDRFVQVADVVQTTRGPGRWVGVEMDYGNRMLRGITAEIEGFPGWRIRLDLSMSGAVTALAMEPTSEAEAAGTAGITARMLRRLPLGELAARARAHALTQAEEMAEAEDNPDWRQYEDNLLIAAIASPARSGQRGKPDIEYARLAAAYVARLRSPTALRDLAGELGYSDSQVRNLLHRARSRGLLTDAPPGRAGGELTTKAIQLLKETKP